MYKRITLSFSGLLVFLLLLTCILGVRAIGKSLYVYCGSIRNHSICENIDGLFEIIDDAFTNNFCLRDSCISVYGLIQRIEGKTVVEDASVDKAVLLGDDGKLYFRGGVTDELNANDEISMQENVNRVSNLKKFCDDRGTNLLYVIAPHKYSSSQVSLPEKRKDFTQDTYVFSDMLTNVGVENLNLMASLLDEEEYKNAFFVTDHHWNIRTAFWGFAKLCDKMNQTFDSRIEKELYDINSYEIITYSDCYLGSMGARVGRFYAGMDDIDAISPLFETELSVSFTSKTLGVKNERIGDFKQAIFADNVPNYSMYITSDNSLIHIDNILNENGNKTLLIKDSFGVPVAAWMACCYDELWVMDLRYSQDETVEEFINNNDVDNVIILHNPEVLNSNTMFKFGITESTQ